MGASPFLELAERHDLDYGERLAPDQWLFSQGEVSDVAGGDLPGGIDGVVARYRTVPEGAAGEGSQAARESTGCLLMTRIPESAALIPYISCRDSEFHGVVDRLIGPGGLIPLIEHVELESIELNRRYRIGIFRSWGENRLRQLFSPTLIDWMAHTAPDGLYFELMSGVFKVTVPGPPEDAANVERVCGLAAHLVDRIRSEAREGGSWASTFRFEAPAAYLEAEREHLRKIEAAGFESPPADVASALERIEPVVRKSERGFLKRVFGSSTRAEAEALAHTAVVRGYARRHDLEIEWPESFVGRHAALPLPRAPMHAMRGQLPGLGIEGDLIVHFSFGTKPVRLLVSPGAAFGWPATADAVLQVAHAEPGEPDPASIGGFRFALADEGARRVSEASRRDRESSAAIARELEGRFRVIGHRCPPGETLAPSLRAWLLAQEPGEGVLIMAGGTVLLIGGAGAANEFSTAVFDRFCESLAPIVAARGA